MAWTIEAPLTRCTTGIRTPSMNNEWLGDRYRSVCGVRPSRARRVTRTGIKPLGQFDAASFLNRLRPIHLTGRKDPLSVTTRSPTEMRSTGISPLSVEIRVPRKKHGTLGFVMDHLLK